MIKIYKSYKHIYIKYCIIGNMTIDYHLKMA